MKANELFGNGSGLPENPSDEEIREAVDQWLGEFRQNILQDMDAMIERDKGTDRESMWRKLRERYAAELDELEKEIRMSN